MIPGVPFILQMFQKVRLLTPYPTIPMLKDPVKEAI